MNGIATVGIDKIQHRLRHAGFGFFGFAACPCLHFIKRDLRVEQIGKMAACRIGIQKRFRARLNRQSRHNQHKFMHAEITVQAEHGLRVGIGFARTRFHLNINNTVA